MNRKKYPKKLRPRCSFQNRVRFPTERIANKSLNAMWKAAIRGEFRGDKMPCRCYKCKHCRGWHLTSQSLRTNTET